MRMHTETTQHEGKRDEDEDQDEENNTNKTTHYPAAGHNATCKKSKKKTKKTKGNEEKSTAHAVIADVVAANLAGGAVVQEDAHQGVAPHHVFAHVAVPPIPNLQVLDLVRSTFISLQIFLESFCRRQFILDNGNGTE